MTGKITLALDATYAAYPERTGVGIYSENLIAALARVIPSEARERYRFVLSFRPGPYVRWTWRRHWPDSFSISPLLDPWLHIPRATLFHGLNQRLPEKAAYPASLFTLHDRYPPPSEDYATATFRQFMSRRIESAIQRADRIIAVSDAVRQHLLLHDRTLAPKVRVIHHGVSMPTYIGPQQNRELLDHHFKLLKARRFFLNVAAVQTRKNISGIVLALKPLREFDLVLAGSDGFGAEEIRSLIRREGMHDRVIFLGHVGHDVLPLLYASATALVFPSLEETFGLPILEAMSHGLPVITSNVSCMPEIAGDAAILVDPHNVEAIREAMRRIAEDEALARELRARGKQRAAQFSWDECGRRTWALYEELLRERA